MLIHKEFLKKQHPLLKTIGNTLIDFDLIHKDMSLLCAVSGGPDSTCLLAVCDYFSNKYGFKLAIAHIHHNLRGKKADQDAEFVKRIAQKANLTFHLQQIDVIAFQKKHKLCLEEAARELRYETLATIARQNKYDRIALGHHADDVSEQLLMNLLRGTGIKGLTGIVPKRNFALGSTENHFKKEIQLIRPLINVYRKDIIGFLKDIHLPYVIDESNHDKRFLRNRVRHELIPILKTYNPNIKQSLNRLADIQRTHMDWVETVSRKFFQDVLIQSDEQQILLDRMPMTEYHKAVVSNIFRTAILKLKGNVKRITHNHIQTLVDWVFEPEKSRRMNLPDHICVHFYDHKIRIHFQSEPFHSKMIQTFHYTMKKTGEIYISERNAILQLDLKEHNCVQTKNKNNNCDKSLSTHHAYLNAETVTFPIVVRNVEPGDRFQPSGMEGHQKLKKFFINNKIPGSKRSKATVLISNNQIVWVIGYRVANMAVISDKTQKVLECNYTLLNQ